MSEFLRALGEHEFLRRALLAGVLCSIACGVVGTYVAARRITYIAGGIAHSLLGGMGAARYLAVTKGWAWLTPLHGAVAAALIAAGLIGLVSLRWREREDTAISAIWAVGMAVGVLFIARTPGYGEDLMSYLFGNILMVAPGDLWLIAVLDAVILAVGLLACEQLLAVCFDEEFARLRGVPVEAFYLVLLCLTALTVVLLVTVVGLVLVIALLALPVAIAARLAGTLWKVMLASAALSCAFTTLGLAVSYDANLPAGATTIVIAGAAYLLVALGAGTVARLRALREPTSPRASAP